MKKLLIFLLIPVFLLTTSVGIAVTSLYCKGKITSKGIVVSFCCKDVNKGGCCNTKAELVKLKTDFVKNQFKHVHTQILVAEWLSNPLYDSQKFTQTFRLKYSRDNGPPLSSKPLYLLFRSLII